LSIGQSNNTFAVAHRALKPKALTTTSSGSTSYCALIKFYLGSSASTIYGFNVYRSTDGTNYTEIGTENYGEATSTSSLGSEYYYYDYDATLVTGTTYYYKVQAFDSSGNLSSMSPVASATFMTPFTVALASPENGTTTGTLTSTSRTFSFALSNIALWSSSYSDYFYFSLFIKNKTGTPVYYGEFRYNFSKGWQIPGSYGLYGAASWSSPTTLNSGVTYSSGTISMDLTNMSVVGNNDSYISSTDGAFSLTSGVTYEWDVFGSWEGENYDDAGSSDAMYPASFVKVDSSSSGSGYGESLANTYYNGEGSTNGSFTFTY
jgi:hypothetical protein